MYLHTSETAGSHFPQNELMMTGLCFMCTTRHLSIMSPGIKCFYCAQTYHGKCLKKKEETETNTKMFVCQTSNN